MLAEGERFVYTPRWLRRLLQRTGMRRHGHAFGDINGIYLTTRLGMAAAVHPRQPSCSAAPFTLRPYVRDLATAFRRGE